MLKLFYATGSCSVATHIALEEVGADYEAVRLDLRAGDQRKPEYKALNPKGRVPALATERGVLSENPAILAYVAQTFPQAKLAPIDDPFAFADVQAFNMFLASTVHVGFAHVYRPGRYADGEEAAAAMRAKAPEALGEYFGIVEEKLSDGRAWIHGEGYTISDPYLFVFASWFERDGFGHPDKFPHLAAHRRRMHERPAVRKVLADEGLAWT